MPPSRCRRLISRAGRGVAVTVAAAVTVSACTSDRATPTAPSFGVPEDSVPGDAPRAEGDVEIETVVMVGDSITVGSEAPLEAGFAALGLDVQAIDAASGRRITADGGSASSGLSAVVGLAASQPDLWVIALGSNDVLQYNEAEEYRNEVATLLNVLPPDAPVVWVDSYLADDPERSAEFNQALRDTLAFRGTATVADWAAVAAGEGVLTDGIHPSAQGTHLFAGVVMSAVERWLGE